MRTHLIATCFILFLFQTATAAEYATDRGATKITAGFAATAYSGDLYEIYEGIPVRVAAMLDVEGHPRSGLGAGLTFSLNYVKDRLGEETVFSLGPFVTFYLHRPSEPSDFKGSILPYVKTGAVMTEEPTGAGGSAVFLYGAFGSDFMIDRHVSIDLSLRFGRIWSLGGRKPGDAIDLVLGAAYHLF